jgi:hypothetical protein
MAIKLLSGRDSIVHRSALLLRINAMSIHLKIIRSSLLLGVWAVFSVTLVQAQNNDLSVTKPNTKQTGYTRSELQSIYRQDVGQGFTTQSLNSIALQNAQARVGYVGQTAAGASGGGRSSSVSSLSPGRAAKPFQSVSSSPTVSPYMNLFREDFDGGGDLNYQTLVRPQFQQLQQNQQFQRDLMEQNYKVQKISAQTAFQNPAGSESIYPTGHQTAFGYYGRYYPGMTPPRGK